MFINQTINHLKIISFLKSFISLSLLIVVVYGCNTGEESFLSKETAQGEWLIQAAHLDNGFYRPITRQLTFKGDSVHLKNLSSENKISYKLEFRQDSLVFDTLVFPIRRYRVNGDKLYFGKWLAHRTMPSDPVDIFSFKKLLLSSYWKNEKGVFHFEKDYKVKYMPKDTDTHLTHCFELVSYEDKVFLLKKGNQLACDRDFQFIEQVLSVSENQIEVFGFVDGDYKKITYNTTAKPQKSVDPVSFQLCNPYINKNYPVDRYYGKGTEYNGGLYHIRKIFAKTYKAPEGSEESGIFQVRFVVNCEGKAGMFEKQAFDYDYNPKEFSDTISNQIFEITKSLQDWFPGRNQRNNEVMDTYIYISFRIKDGKIIRIYP